MNNKNRQKAISTGLPIAMFTLYRMILDSFSADTKTIPDKASVHP